MKDDTDPPVDANDDITLRGYQDDLDTSDTMADQATHDVTDDPVETFGIPADEYKNELDKLDVDEDSDDQREDIEDRDENDSSAASTSV